MDDVVELWERPKADELYMIVGWRQWADGGSVSSGLPRYLVELTDAHPIGELHPDNFYLFQFPGTHDLVRPVVRFEDGYPKALETPRNEFFYSGDEQRGLILFLGDEPHLNAERYTRALLDVAETLGVRRIVGLGGVYAEFPHDKERMVSSVYSLPELKKEVERLAVNLSDYHGGASIGSYVCRRAGERGLEYVSFYAFVPNYSFSGASQIGNTIRIENDVTAWLGVMRRINHMLRLGLDLSDLERRSARLNEEMDNKIEELDRAAPQLGIRDYLARLSEEFNATPFDALDAVWEEEVRHLLDDLDLDDL